MAQYLAAFGLSTIDGHNGFQSIREVFNDYLGNSVSDAGDVNGDGFADVIVGALGADPHGGNSGSSYVVFGKASAFSMNLKLANLDGNNGFQIDGKASGDYSGYSVSTAGDLNGDGFDDVIIGAWGADVGGSNCGASYVVFGKASGFSTTLALSSLDGNNGFEIRGEASFDQSGQAVSSAGDINGDGVDDVIVGAPHADPHGREYAGTSYVVFGKLSGFDAVLQLSTLDGNNGFRINGAAEQDLSGNSLSSAGDVNGDGYADLIVGTYANGFSDSYVVFGKAHFSANLNVASLDGRHGFRLHGTSSVSISSAGDVNADGFDDVIVGDLRASPNGSGSGASYVVFGQSEDFASTFDLSSLDGGNGFRIDGESFFDFSGASVSSAGDVNGDGFGDLLVGAPETNFDDWGTTYVIFGKASGFSPAIELSSLDGNNGFRIDGRKEYSYNGHSVSSAGDINGDGFDDIFMGPKLTYYNGHFNGSTYVVFGGKPGEAVVRAGTDIANTIHGSDFDDRLDGLGGDDTLIGHDGRDIISGGHGNDVLIGGGAGDQLVGRAGTNTFVYEGISDSAGAEHDRVRNMDGAIDKFDLWFTVTGMDAPVNSNLHHLVTDLDGHLEANHAVLVNGSERTFLVIDANGIAGYQSGGDLLIQLKNVDHPDAIGVSSFI